VVGGDSGVVGGGGASVLCGVRWGGGGVAGKALGTCNRPNLKKWQICGVRPSSFKPYLGENAGKPSTVPLKKRSLYRDSIEEAGRHTLEGSRYELERSRKGKMGGGSMPSNLFASFPGMHPAKRLREKGKESKFKKIVILLTDRGL